MRRRLIPLLLALMLLLSACGPDTPLPTQPPTAGTVAPGADTLTVRYLDVGRPTAPCWNAAGNTCSLTAATSPTVTWWSRPWKTGAWRS